MFLLQLSPPDLTKLLGPIEYDLARSAQANSDEYNRLFVTAIKQRLLNEPSQSLLSTDPTANRALLDEVADFMISLHKVCSNDVKGSVPISKLNILH